MRTVRRPSMPTRLIAPAAALAVALVGLAAPSNADNPVTPGNFTGYGFDQCETVSQAKMDRWLTHSPFFAVGVYISGNSRACRKQTNLTPRWVSTQLANGWRILPITLGPQSTCVGRYPRYGAHIDPTINESTAYRYRRARQQAADEGRKAVAAARELGIPAGSTLWYDLEGWSDYRDVSCRESALNFLSTWTQMLHRHDYVSGVYSSAGSGMRILDDARVQRPRAFTLPDRIWIARWDGKANTSTSYIREDGWRPGNRMKQYQGGHNETWGGATINIDRDFLDLGRGSAGPRKQWYCGNVNRDFGTYDQLSPASPRSEKVRALQCLLRENRLYDGVLNGHFNLGTLRAVQAWQRRYGHPVGRTWTTRNWVARLTHGRYRVAKVGSAGLPELRVERALNAAGFGPLPLDGSLHWGDIRALRDYQRSVGLPVTGVAAGNTWAAFKAGRH